MLYKILEKSLRMLHPFMPFITEEIWRKLPRSKDSKCDSIMVQPWPHIQQNMISKDAENAMKRLMDIVVSIRNIRAVWNIELKREISAVINIHEKKDEKFLNDNSDFIKKLSKVAELKIGAKIPKPKNSAVSVVGRLELYIPLEGLIDFEKERMRLQKEEDRLNSEIKAIAGRLKDKDFVLKAPEDVVEKQRMRKTELELQMKKLRKNLKDIG